MPNCSCRSVLTCCGDSAPIGRCQLSFSLAAPTAVTANIHSLGSYTLHCDVAGDAGKCGAADDSSDLVLSSQGEVYLLNYVVVEGTGAKPLFASDTAKATCATPVGFSRQQHSSTVLSDYLAWRTATHVMLQAAITAKSMDQAGTMQEDAPLYLGSEVYAFSGPVTVTSKAQGTKWKEGFVDLVYGSTIVQATAAKIKAAESIVGALPRIASVELNQYHFQLFKDRSE